MLGQRERLLSFESRLIRKTSHNRYPVPEWVDQQVYLHPYPKELLLRHHVSIEGVDFH